MWWSKQSSQKNRNLPVKPVVAASRRRAPLMMPLEPRFMFDGAVAASHAEGVHLAVEHGATVDRLRPVEATAATTVAASGPAVIFIDSRVEDPVALLKGVVAGTEVVYLQANQDGLQQMATYLAAHPEVGSVEIIAHGNDGELQLGSTDLSSANINSYAKELGTIGSNLKQGADILVYACNTAADATGLAFVDTMAQLTGHNIAAASGEVGLGGSWDLEVTTGDITAVPVLSARSEASYAYDLGAIDTAEELNAAIIVDDGDSTNDTITLTGDITFTAASTIVIDHTGSGTLTINGNGYTINAAYYSQVMAVTAGKVVLENVTIENGLVSGAGGGYGASADSPTAGGAALGAGLSVTGGSTVVTMNGVTVTSNDATGGGGGGSGNAYSYGGGGGSGIAGVGGGKGGRYNTTTGVPTAGFDASGGNGGSGGYVGAFTYAGKGGIGGNTTGSVTGNGGAGGGNVSAGGIVSGGAGAKAGNGTSAVGGGGGGSGLGGTVGGAGGKAVGGLYVGSGGKVYIANTTFSHNYGAGGGGGGSYAGTAGAGGSAAGAIMVGTSGILKYQSSSVFFPGNDGEGGSGGKTYTGSGGGTAGLNGVGTGTSNVATVAIQNLGAASDVSNSYSPPSLATGSGNSGFIEANPYTSNTGVVVDSGITLTDAGTVASATITLTNEQAGDTLAFSNTSGSTYGNIAGSFSGGLLTLSSSGDSASVTQWHNALDAVTFDNSAASPSTTQRTITVSVTNTDSSSSNTINETVNVTPTYQSPVTSTSGGTTSYTGGTAATVIDGSAAVTESDGTALSSATVTIGGAHAGDTLAFTNTNGAVYGNISSSIMGSTLVLSSSGNSATIAQWDAALDAVTFSSTSGTTPGNRTISFVVTNSDSETSNTSTKTVAVIVPPSLVAGGGTSVFTEADPYTSNTAVAIDSGITLSDASSGTITSGAVTLTNAKTGDTLAFTNNDSTTFGNIVGSYSSVTGILTLSSSSNSATVAQWRAALDAVTFDNTAALPDITPRAITVSVTDANSLTSNTLNETVDVTHTDQSPVTSTSGGTTSYTGGAAAIVIDGSAAVTESDGTALSSASIIMGGMHAGDTLAFTNTNGAVYGNISSSIMGSTLVLSSSGNSATIAQWNAALEAVTFSSTSGTTPGDRTINFTVTNSDSESSNTSTKTVTVTVPPSLAAGGGTSVFTEADPYTSNTAVAIDSGITLSDASSGTITSGAVTLTNAKTGDTLAFTNNDSTTFGNIVGSYSSVTGILTLSSSSNSATVAQWQAALDAVTFDNTAALPDITPRAITVSVTDANSLTSNTLNETVDVTHTDQSPVASTSGGSTNYSAGTAATVVDSGAAVTESDGTALSSATVTIGAGGQAGDALAFSNTNALTFGNILGSFSGSVLTLISTGSTASAAQWNAALDAVTFSSTAGTTTGDRTISFVVTNSDSEVSNAASKTVDVIPPPPDVTSVGAPSAATYGTGQELIFTVNFSENVTVTGTPYIPITLDTGGIVHAVYVSGSGTGTLTFEYTVVSGNDDTTGVAVGSAIVLDGGTIADAYSSAAVLTLNDVGSTSDVLVDAIPPTVTSIDIAGTSPNNASSETYTVTFSAPVTGVDATDFTVVGTVTASGTVSSVSGSGATWTVTVGSVVGDGTLRLDLNNSGDAITDNYGNHLAAAYTNGETYTIEHTAPSVTSVTVPAPDTYVAGEALTFTATFSEAVTVDTTGGTPRIAIDLTTGGTVYANYVSGSGSNTLTFSYTVVAGEQDLTGISTPGSVIDLNGGTIKDAATNAASGSGLDLTGEASLSSVDVDAIVPAVSDVVVPINGTYGTNQDLDFTVDFTKVVNVDTSGGTPYIQIALTTGGTVDATYLSGSGSTSLVFRYVVASGELDTTGITVGSSIVMAGGTIKDAIGNNAATTLNSVGSTTGVLVDSILPTVTSIDTVDASTNNLSTEQFTVTFSTDVSLNPPDTTDFTLHDTGITGTISSVTATSGSVYTVTVTGVTGDGTMRLDLNTSGSAITDAYGNQVTAAHTGDQTYTIEHTPPSATAMTVPGNGTYGTGGDLTYTVTFSEAVTVTGDPRLSIALTTGGTVYANYLSGSGTNTLTFQYAVVSGEQDLTGITNAASIDANGGTIKDAAGNNAVLTVSAVEPSTAGVDVDSILPVVTSVGVPASATYIAGQDLDFTVNLDKSVTVTGTPYITLTLTDGGTVDAQYISGSGTSTLTFRYVVQPGNLDLTGVTLGSTMVLNGGTIDDAHNNPAVLALAGVPSTSGVIVDAVPPIVTSIDTTSATLTNASTVTYTVTFSEAVTGVNASDFTLTDTGATTGTIASVTAVSGSVYTVTVDNINGDGTMRLDLNSSGTGIADLATNPIATGYTAGEIYTFDHQSPQVVSVGVPAAGTYLAGQDLNFTVTYNEAVTVSGTPEIAVTLNTGVVYAHYVSGSGTNTLDFSYVVAAGNLDTNGIVVNGAITANGATVQDSIGNNATLALNDVGNTTHVLVDGTDPTVSSVDTVGNTTTNAASVSYTVTFSEAVSGVTASDFTLATSGSATGSIESVTAVGGSSNTYTVTVDNVSGAGTLRLDVNPSSGIVDAAGTAVPGYSGGESYTVDRIVPTVTEVSVPANGTYIDGQTLDFTVTYSTAVTLNTSGGEPTLTIELANGKTEQAQLLGATGNQLTFQYTVVAGDQDLTGIALGSSINLNGATLQDTYGNAADTTLHGVASTALVDVDAVAPTVTAVQVPAVGLYTPGEQLNLVVSYSEAVTVNTAGGTPGIAITLDSGTVIAHYVSGSGSNELTFSYTVASGNLDKAGIVVANAIGTNGGSISSADGNVAALALNNVGSTANVDVGPAAGGTGRGLLPGCENQPATPPVDPFVWVLPAEGANNHQPSPEILPSTTQDTWSPVPLLSAGQQGVGHIDPGVSRGDETAIGSSGFTAAHPSVIEQIVSPQPDVWAATTRTNLDRSNILTWQAPSTVESHVQNASDLFGVLNSPSTPQLLRDATPAAARTIDARLAAHADKHAPAPVVALHPAGRPVPSAGKASLNQQFSRYGKAAWEREKSVLVDHAQRNAQRRAG